MSGRTWEELATYLALGDLLRTVADGHGGYTLSAHWTQGEFHHDVVVTLDGPGPVPAPVLVIATNCNGGVKELLALEGVPSRDALWHHRVPESDEFATDPLPPLVAEAQTIHWFDPRELLRDDARSELRPEHRVRQRGGGWQLRS